MATSPLTDLPTELLQEIIPHVLPEGFESLALTSKKFYELCTPFMDRHNRLRWQFRNFRYGELLKGSSVPHFTTALDLIVHIAFEPTVAHYISDADLSRDTFHRSTRTSQRVPDVHHDGPVVRLFASSPYLRQAGLDWKEYYAAIQDDLKDGISAYYSQHAAAFLLTLLPNVKSLALPKLWKPLDKTEKLLDVIVRETKQSSSPWARPSLARVTTFELCRKISARQGYEFDTVVPFLFLPRIQSFRGFDAVAIDNASTALASRDPYLRYGEALETAILLDYCIDEVALADILKHTPRLRILQYSHFTRRDSNHRKWNINKFVAAIERGVGSYLEELSISIHRLRGSIVPGKASVRGFQRPRKLEFPLQFAMCNVTDATSGVTTVNEGLTDREFDEFVPFISDLVPASVSQLSLLSRGTDHHQKVVRAMFRDFAAKKDSQLPALKEIHLSCPEKTIADAAYEEECAKLVAETKEAGVVLHLHDLPFSIATVWYRALDPLPFFDTE
jgi:hypothetical protein